MNCPKCGKRLLRVEYVTTKQLWSIDEDGEDDEVVSATHVETEDDGYECESCDYECEVVE
jgi:predicted RNA-binding Zn-ribbon protein involved in translation (DUF1610 family)